MGKARWLRDTLTIGRGTKENVDMWHPNSVLRFIIREVVPYPQFSGDSRPFMLGLAIKVYDTREESIQIGKFPTLDAAQANAEQLFDLICHNRNA